MKWLAYGVLFLAVWYVFRKVENEVFEAIDKRVYPDNKGAV